jgi:hypothetical protein
MLIYSSISLENDDNARVVVVKCISNVCLYTVRKRFLFYSVLA